MNVEEIAARRNELEKIIRYNLTIHTKSDILKVARAELLELQKNCPHKEMTEICPYCGKKN